jgi:hypothetical protein
MRALATIAFVAVICGVWFILWSRYVNPLWDRFCDWRISQAKRRYERQLVRLRERRQRALARLEDTDGE